MKKKILGILLLLSILSSFMPTIVIAEIVDGGTCGANGYNLTWTFDSEGTLTISGDGKMSIHDFKSPWADIRQKAKKIVIEYGVTNIDGMAFNGFSEVTDVNIANSVTEIGSLAFEGCSSLSNIIIPNSIKFIYGQAFSGCSSLENVVLPDSITEWSGGIFRFCNNLKHITLPKDINFLSGDFWGCTSLKNLIIPKTVLEIKARTFYNCPNLTDIYYGGTEDEWNNIIVDFGNDDLYNATIHYNSTTIPTPILGEPIADDNHDGTYTVTASVSDIPYNCELICVMYDNDTVSGFNSKTVTSSDSSAEIIVNADRADTAKVFLWDSLYGMKPLCEAKSSV